jgi:hypothetical protein
MPKKPDIRNNLRKGRKIKKDRPLLLINEEVFYQNKYIVKVIGYDYFDKYLYGELMKGHLYIVENEDGFVKTVSYEEIYNMINEDR